MQHELDRLRGLAFQLRLAVLAMGAAQRAGDEAKLAATLDTAEGIQRQLDAELALLGKGDAVVVQ